MLRACATVLLHLAAQQHRHRCLQAICCWKLPRSVRSPTAQTRPRFGCAESGCFGSTTYRLLFRRFYPIQFTSRPCLLPLLRNPALAPAIRGKLQPSQAEQETEPLLAPGLVFLRAAGGRRLCQLAEDLVLSVFLSGSASDAGGEGDSVDIQGPAGNTISSLAANECCVYMQDYASCEKVYD